MTFGKIIIAISVKLIAKSEQAKEKDDKPNKIKVVNESKIFHKIIQNALKTSQQKDS